MRPFKMCGYVHVPCAVAALLAELLPPLLPTPSPEVAEGRAAVLASLQEDSGGFVNERLHTLMGEAGQGVGVEVGWGWGGVLGVEEGGIHTWMEADKRGHSTGAMPARRLA